MINGEGTGETISEVASPDPSDSFPPFWGPKSDGSDASPVLSRYSSCGESEFDRYCSANSAMNTPSLCSSIGVFNDCESEFGSMKSFGFGDDNSSLENFSLGGKFEKNQVERRLSSSDLPSVSGLNSDFNKGVCGEDEIEGFDAKGSVEILHSKEFISEKSLGGELLSIGNGNGSQVVQGIEESSSSHMVAEEVDGLYLQSDLLFDRGGMGREEDESSSRYEHSEDEDSIRSYGSDDERRNNSYFHRNIQYRKEENAGNENPLLINTSVAFGSEDWDDFVQETEGTTLASLTLDSFHEQKDHNLETERNLLNSTSATVPSIRKTEQGKDVSHILVTSKQVQGAGELAEDISSCSEIPVGILMVGEPEQVKDARDIPLASRQVQGAGELAEYTKNNSTTSIDFRNFQGPKQEETRDIPVTTNQAGGADESANYIKDFYGNDGFEMEQEPLAEEAPLGIGLNIMDCCMDGEHQCVNAEKAPLEVVGIDESRVLENQEMGNSITELDPFSDTSIKQLGSHSTESPRNINAEFFEDHVPNSPLSMFEYDTKTTLKNSAVSADLLEVHPTPVKTENLELNEFYDELVNEMEEILLDSGESLGSRFPQGNKIVQSQLSPPLRDGGSTASTSGTDDAYSFIQHPLRIDKVEVVGAKQKKGDVSLSERLVGVKEYTVYKIRVCSGKDQWEVERRYRDFFTLYRRLKTFFADHGWILPPPWSSVDKESRKIFGNASPDVIAERSVLIQECLHSILHSRFFSSPPSALIWFLSPQDSIPGSPASNTLVRQSTFFTRGADTESISALGKTISLTVEIPPNKSMKQMLEAQHYTCAGCHKHFDDGKTLMLDFVQTFGWGKPRLCEYTGQLFCSSCHTNEAAVLPARVLHHWDFTLYSVSQLAKSYLDSIHDQPMLCVSAVNPFLFSKVPALLHVMSVRKKIGTMLPYVRCPFHRTINKGLGSRRYLLESNDFFALRDLIDLSKGAFAALPVMVETVSTKILEHITEQCLICCDVGVPCGARQACNDSSSLIFPFQEGEVERCTSCKSVFHKPCFRNLTDCPCGALLRVDEAVGTTKRVGQRASGEVSGALDVLGRRSGSTFPAEFLYRLFPKTKLEKSREHKDSDNIILMGSLPSTSLEM